MKSSIGDTREAMFELQGMLTCAVAAMLLSFGAGTAHLLSAPAAGVARTLEVREGNGGAAVLVEAMSVSRPRMSEAVAARFDGVLAAARTGDPRQLDAAWQAFAVAYFDDPAKQAHRRDLELLVFAAVTDEHAPAVAKEAREAARFKQRRDRLARYVEAVERALKAAEASGKPVAIEFSVLDGKAGPSNKPLTAAELAERLVTATRNRDAMNQSFNLQYLTLQQQMRTDNRQYGEVAVIMKTKHDSAKNAVY